MVWGRAMLALQVPARHAAGRGPGVAWTVVLAAIFASALLAGTVLLLDFRQRRLRSREPDDEYRTRLLMEELCPAGWKAQITVYGLHAPRPEDAPRVPGPLVRLEWSEYGAEEDADGRRVAVVRRVWERSIAAAQARMIAERRLDLTLEDVERRVLGDDPGADV